MVTVEGFDSAIIGTGLRATGREVLVYDANKAQMILNSGMYAGVDIVEYLYGLGIDSLGDNAPIFVFLDDEIVDELGRARKGGFNLVH